MRKLLLFLMLLCFAAGAHAQCSPQVKIVNLTSCPMYYRINAAAGCVTPPVWSSIMYAIPAGGSQGRTIANTTFSGGTPPPTAVFHRIYVSANPSGTCGSTSLDVFGPTTGTFINTCCPGPPVIVDWNIATLTITIHY